MMTRWKTSARFVICLLTAASAQAALPEPPKQHEPWPAPSATGIPDYVVKVARLLFDAGLADPRGGEYREVEIFNRHNEKNTMQTHAWVFPGDFAVSWDGLVYRVKASGARANLDQDIRAIVAANPWGGRMPIVFRRDPEPATAVFWSDLRRNQTLVPASIALLARLGRTDLAAQLWQSGPHEDEEGLWLAAAATAWFATAYSRLVGMFGTANDDEAADIAESILLWRSRVPESWRVRNNGVPKRIPDISFLDHVPDLLRDSQRRLRGPKRETVDLLAVGQDKTGSAEFLKRPQAARIAYLIERLENVRGEKMMWPGPLMYSGDPVFDLLKKEGDAAVEGLLAAYENDQRLTRTFDYSRPWSIEYTPVPVHQVIEILLGDILGTARVQSSTPAELRAWWQQRKSTSRSERSFELLADDRASPAQWLEAADYLTTRSDLQWSEGGKMSPPGACDPKKNAPDVNGRELRTRQNPSVMELLAKRTASLAQSGSDVACSMAVKAALWDLSAALPVLQQAAASKSCRANHLFATARLAVGIPGAAAEWAMELPGYPGFPPLRTDQLSPLWMFPDDPALLQTAERLFAQPDSPWSPAMKYTDVHSPLLAIPVYRKAVFSALGDSRVVGKAGRTAEGWLSFQVTSGGSGGSFGPSDDPRQAPPGQDRPIRVMDLVAWELSGLDGAPEFGLDWPDRDKDAAISAIAEFLRMHEGEIHAFPMTLQDTSCPGNRVYVNR